MHGRVRPASIKRDTERLEKALYDKEEEIKKLRKQIKSLKTRLRNRR